MRYRRTRRPPLQTSRARTLRCFYRHVDMTDPRSDCWKWTARLINGYGTFTTVGRPVMAHRASYMLHVGDIPTGHDVDHLCNVRHCVNPDHLEPTTRAENQRRAVLRARGSKRVPA